MSPTNVSVCTWRAEEYFAREFGGFGLDDDLNVKKSQRASVALVWCAAVLTICGQLFPLLLSSIPLAIAVVAWLNRDFYRFLAKRRGVWFAARLFPMHVLFFFYSGLGYLYARFREPALP